MYVYICGYLTKSLMHSYVSKHISISLGYSLPRYFSVPTTASLFAVSMQTFALYRTANKPVLTSHGYTHVHFHMCLCPQIQTRTRYLPLNLCFVLLAHYTAS